MAKVKYKEIVKRENMLSDMLDRIQKTSADLEKKMSQRMADNNKKIDEITSKANLDLAQLYLSINEKSQRSKEGLYKKFILIDKIIG